MIQLDDTHFITPSKTLEQLIRTPLLDGYPGIDVLNTDIPLSIDSTFQKVDERVQGIKGLSVGSNFVQRCFVRGLRLLAWLGKDGLEKTLERLNQQRLIEGAHPGIEMRADCENTLVLEGGMESWHHGILAASCSINTFPLVDHRVLVLGFKLSTFTLHPKQKAATNQALLIVQSYKKSCPSKLSDRGQYTGNYTPDHTWSQTLRLQLIQDGNPNPYVACVALESDARKNPLWVITRPEGAFVETYPPSRSLFRNPLSTSKINFSPSLRGGAYTPDEVENKSRLAFAPFQDELLPQLKKWDLVNEEDLED